MAISVFTSFRTYVLSSLLLTSLLLSHAIYTKRFFYRTCVYLANSKFAVLAVANMALVTELLVWRLIQHVFLGPLRFRELERLHIRARDAIIEVCFAISVFRDEFNLRFVALVMCLLLVKSLHWLTKDRVEFLEEQPLSPRRTHIRLIGLICFLACVDAALIYFTLDRTVSADGRTMFVLFVFEFTVLAIDLLGEVFRYAFHLVDHQLEGRWEAKGLYTFYAELLCDMCQLAIYLLFFIYNQIYYSFPYHIIRELYMTFHKFTKRCTDFMRYRRVVATMNDLFADATEEDLSADRTCIICREEMTAAKKLSCGHLFHARCLQSWLKRQLTCPTCRDTIDVSGNANRNRSRSQQQPNVQNQNQPPLQNRNNPPPNANGNPAPQPPQRNQGDGDPGARLLNFANQWWHNIMRDAGARPANPGAAPQPPAHPRVPGFAQPGMVPPPPGMRMQANAIAHMQLRARRRGALVGYQPYRMQAGGAPGMRAGVPVGGNGTNGTGGAQRGAQGGQPPATASVHQAGPSRSGGSSSATGSGSATGASTSSEERSASTPAPSPTFSSGHTSAPSQQLPSQQPGPLHGGVNTGYSDSAFARTNAYSLPLERLLAIQEQIEILRGEVQALVLLATSEPHDEAASGAAVDDEAGLALSAGAAAPGAVEAETTPAVECNETRVGNQDADADSQGPLMGAENLTQGSPPSSSTTTEATAAPETVTVLQEAVISEEGIGPGPQQDRERQEDEDSEAARLRRRRIEFLERLSAS